MKCRWQMVSCTRGVIVTRDGCPVALVDDPYAAMVLIAHIQQAGGPS